MRSIPSRLRAAGLMAVAGVVVLAAAMPLIGQDAGDREGRRRGRPDFRNLSEEQREQLRERFQERREQMEQRRQERLRNALGMSEEEFAAVNPMIEKIRRYRAEREMASRVRPGGDDDGDRDRGRRRGPRGRGAGVFGRFGPGGGEEMTAEAKKLRESMQQLRDAVGDESLSADQVRARVEAVRQARSRMDKVIDQTQKELRGVLLARQEAVLVMGGVLD